MSTPAKALAGMSFACTFLTICMMANAAQATMLVAAEGDVKVNTGDGFKSASGAMPLRVGDTIEVGNASAARLLFSDGCGYSPAAGTRIVVSAQSPCSMRHQEVGTHRASLHRSGYQAYVINGPQVRTAATKRRVYSASYARPALRPQVLAPSPAPHHAPWQPVENVCPQPDEGQPAVTVQHDAARSLCGPVTPEAMMVAPQPAVPAATPVALAGSMSATTATLLVVGSVAIGGGLIAVSQSGNRRSRAASP